MARSHRSHKTVIPAPPVRVLNQFEQLAQLFSRWEGSIEQHSCGRFEGTILAARGRQMHAHLATANQSVLVRGRDGSGLVSVGLVLPESVECYWQRRKLDSGQLVLRGGDIDVDHHTSRQAVNMTLTVSEEWFQSAARIVTRTDPRTVGWRAIQPPPDAFDALETTVRRFLTTATGGESGSHDAALLEQACVRAAVEAVFSPTAHRAELLLADRAALVGRAEEVMRAHLRVPVGEIDLCAELEVSGRTLRRAFRERYGLGPMAYYQSLRLNAARAVLKTAESEGLSVEAIARSVGFHHPGKFAWYYHRLFGELPSRR